MYVFYPASLSCILYHSSFRANFEIRATSMKERRKHAHIKRESACVKKYNTYVYDEFFTLYVVFVWIFL